MDAQEKFKQDLLALLKKWEIVMSIEENGPWKNPTINFFSYSKYDKDGKLIREKIDLNLTYEDGKA